MKERVKRAGSPDTVRAVTIGLIKHELEQERGYAAWIQAVLGAVELLDSLDSLDRLGGVKLGAPHAASRGTTDARRLACTAIRMSEKLARRHFRPDASIDELAAQVEKERISTGSLDDAPGSAKRSLGYPGIILVAHVATALLAAACEGVDHAVAKTFRSRDLAEAAKHPWQHQEFDCDSGPLLSMGLQLQLGCGEWLLCPPVPHTPYSAAHVRARGAALARIRAELGEGKLRPEDVDRHLADYEQAELARDTGRQIPGPDRPGAHGVHHVLTSNAGVIAELLGLPAWILEMSGLLPIFDGTPITGFWLVDPDGQVPELNAAMCPLGAWDPEALDAAGNCGLGIPTMDLHMNGAHRSIGVDDYPHQITTVDGTPVAELAGMSADAIERHRGWSVHVRTPAGKRSLDAAVSLAIGPALIQPYGASRPSRRHRTVALRLDARGAVSNLQGPDPKPGWLVPDHNEEHKEAILDGIVRDISTWSDRARDPLHSYRVLTGAMNPSGKNLAPGETQSACAALAVNLLVAVQRLRVDPPNWASGRENDSPPSDN
jgi:hypothetical protein